MKLILFALALTIQLDGADWLSAHNHTQPSEKELSSETVRDLKLLWKLSLNERLTAPVILGPIFTHRGIKEIVFVAGAADNLYAVDADLGRPVWKRHFDVAPNCSNTLTAAPVLAPYYGPAPEGDDASTPRRSLFVLSSDGQLHTLRPADGHDLALPRAFLTPGSKASDLDLKGNVISTFVSGGCAIPQTGEWSLALNASGRPTIRTAAPLAPAPVNANGLAFTLSGSTLVVTDQKTGKKLFTSPPNGTEPVTAQLALANGHVYIAGGNTIYCYGFPIEI